MTEEREALIAHALDIATKGVQINDGHKYLVAAADLVDFAETIKALTEMLRPQGVYQYRVQHPRYTEGLKDDFQWTRLLGVVQEIAQDWGPDAWIERRFVGPIERVQDSETPA